MHAVARVDWGRWVADCPNPDCTNAMELASGQRQWACRFTAGGRIQGCGTIAPIDWPKDVAEIEAGIAGKPESAQQWRPEARK